MKKISIILIGISLLASCGNPEPAVKSPFSTLDTVTVKNKEVKPEEEKKNDGGVKSPFSGLDKK